MTVTRETSKFGEGPTAESFQSFRTIRRRNLPHMNRACIDTWKAGAAQWLVHKIFQSNTDAGFHKYQTQNRAMVDHSAKLTQATSIMQHSWTDTIIVPNCPKTRSATTTESWAHGSWSRTNQSWQRHWQHFGWEHSQDLLDPPECHNWRWLPSHIRITHR